MIAEMAGPRSPGLVEEIRAEQLRVKRAARREGIGVNLANAVTDVSLPFPWEEDLRRISPKTMLHSWLLAYWYRTAGRWVLYDALPVELIDPDASQGCPATGEEILTALAGIDWQDQKTGFLRHGALGPRPSEAPDYARCDYVSDVQHEMYRLHRVYARPFWVLQGEQGGHPVGYAPQIQNLMLAKGLPPDPPVIGSLPPCPFDLRVSAKLQTLNRLHQLDDSLDRLRKSGSVEFANAETAKLEREIRETEMAFIETQMTPLVDMSTSLVHGMNSRSEHDDQIIRVPDGMASRAADAYAEYRETGNYTLKNLTLR